MIEIKPCPFCGSADVELKNGMMWGYAVHCNECGADVIFHGLLRADNLDYDYSDEVIRAWNTRKGEA